MADQAKTRSVSWAQRLVFWDFPRASWPYDLVVGLILIFIFVTPREWFHDQPKASSVILMSSIKGSNSVFIATGLLADTPRQQRPAKAESLIQKRTGKRWHVARVEPIRDDAEHEIKGFIAYTTP